MKFRIAAAPSSRRARAARTGRPPRPATVIALVVAATLGGTGIAGAATGGSFILGRGDRESSTASLSSSRGSPLSLSAPKRKAPLAVNRNVEVKNLNAAEVGGLTSSSLKLTGGTGFAPPNADIAITHDVFTQVVSTGPLPAGAYYVQASALIDLTPGDTTGTCIVQKVGGPALFGGGGGDGSNFVQAATTVVMRLTTRGAVNESCITDGTGSGSEVIDAGIIAIRILSSSGKPPSEGSLNLRR
jgi:hypothetical protein